MDGFIRLVTKQASFRSLYRNQGISITTVFVSLICLFSLMWGKLAGGDATPELVLGTGNRGVACPFVDQEEL